MSTIIDGKALAQRVKGEVAEGAREFTQRYGREPALHVILVGEDQASSVYVRMKEKAVAAAGMKGAVHRLPESVSAGRLLELVLELNRQDDVDGILVQLPLPKHIAADPILEAVDPAKDVDGFHAQSVGRLWLGKSGGFVPCTPRGCIRLLKSAGVALEGARAVVVGRSNIVGKPMAALLLAENATVTLAHSRTRDLAAHCREADILIAAAGQPRLIKGDWIKPGATVIDVGVHRLEGGGLCGDVDFEAARAIAGAITPVPGGVRPMTIAMLLENTLLAAQARCAA